MFIVDGKKIAGEIKEELKKEVATLGRAITLLVIRVGDDSVTTGYLEVKRKFGEAIGVPVVVKNYPETISEEEILKIIKEANQNNRIDGIVVQLPLPSHLDTSAILSEINPGKDPDALSPSPKVLAPVAAAIQEIFSRHGVSILGKKVVVLGGGKLVGKPVAGWLEKEGARPVVLTSSSKNALASLLSADIVISGVGISSFVKPEMVKEGVVLVDAGTSEQGGKLSGDIDPACAGEASLFTPVPGGVGPVAVAMLFKNLLQLVRE